MLSRAISASWLKLQAGKLVLQGVKQASQLASVINYVGRCYDSVNTLSFILLGKSIANPPLLIKCYYSMMFSAKLSIL